MSSLENPSQTQTPMPNGHLLKGDPPDIQNSRDAKKAKNTEGDGGGSILSDTPSSSFFFQGKGNKPKGKEIKLGEYNEIELEDDDVIIDTSGSTASIRFSDRIHNEIKDSIKQTIDVRLLAGGLGYKGLEAAIKAIWKPKGDFTIMDLENNFYVIQFSLETDYIHALLGGPWIVRETYLTVQPWTPTFSARNFKISSLAAWVRLPGLPFHLYHKSLIRAIRGLIGNVLRIDYNTSLGGEVNLRGWRWKLMLLKWIEYEGLPSVCYKCGFICYVVEKCPKPTKMIVLEKTTKPNSENGSSESKETSAVTVVKEVTTVEQ